MARDDKSVYSEKQMRQADHIEEGYRKRGVKKATAEARAWAIVKKMIGGGNKSGAGHGAPLSKESGNSASAKKSPT